MANPNVAKSTSFRSKSTCEGTPTTRACSLRLHTPISPQSWTELVNMPPAYASEPRSRCRGGTGHRALGTGGRVHVVHAPRPEHRPSIRVVLIKLRSPRGGGGEVWLSCCGQSLRVRRTERRSSCGRRGHGVDDPGSFAGYLDQVGGDLPTLSSELGVFYPRKDRESDPVALAFVNGLAIARTSKNPDLAWELIKYLMRDEVQQRIHETAGWMPPRVELASQFVTNPLLPAAYDAVQYLIAAAAAARNVSQNELDAWLYRVLRSEVPPEEAMLAVHDLWSRLLAEWGAAVSK